MPNLCFNPPGRFPTNFLSGYVLNYANDLFIFLNFYLDDIHRGGLYKNIITYIHTWRENISTWGWKELGSEWYIVV